MTFSMTFSTVIRDPVMLSVIYAEFFQIMLGVIMHGVVMLSVLAASCSTILVSLQLWYQWQTDLNPKSYHCELIA
jgi:hypothetical protein